MSTDRYRFSDNYRPINNTCRPALKTEPISTQDTKCHYVVLVGKRPGIYADVAEARQQLDGHLDSNYIKCEDRASAIELMRSNGGQDKDIRLFRGAFDSQSNFKPNPSATFNSEFKRLAGTQNWTEKETRKARVDAIRDEIIKHCLPNGVRVLTEQQYQVDDNMDVYLDEEQYLEVYQAMCRRTGKRVQPTIDESLLELKGKPYVNILDLIDTFRTGQKLRAFQDWTIFAKYTMQRRKIDRKYARESDLLAPLLQDLIKGPNAVDPCAVRRRHMARRAKNAPQRSRGRKCERTMTPPVSTAELPRDLSPFVFDQASLPSTPLRSIHQRLPTPGPGPDPYCSLSSQEGIEESDYDSASDVFEDEDIIKMVAQSSQKAEGPEESTKSEHLDDFDFDSDSDVFEEVIKLGATQPELFNPERSQKPIPATCPAAMPGQKRIKPEKENMTPQPQLDDSTQESVVEVPQTPPSLSWSATSPAEVDSSKDCRTPLSPICCNGTPTKKMSDRKRRVDCLPKILRRSKRMRTGR